MVVECFLLRVAISCASFVYSCNVNAAEEEEDVVDKNDIKLGKTKDTIMGCHLRFDLKSVITRS